MASNNRPSRTFDRVGVLIMVVVVLVPGIFVMNKILDSYNWRAALSREDLPVVSPALGQTANLSEAKDYRHWAVLTEPGSVCKYSIDGVPAPLPSVFNNENSPSRYAFRIKPQADDLNNIEVKGKSWNWVSTVRKSSSQERSVSCSGAYLLVEKPELGFFQTLGLASLISAYSIAVILAYLQIRMRLRRRGQVRQA